MENQRCQAAKKLRVSFLFSSVVIEILDIYCYVYHISGMEAARTGFVDSKNGIRESPIAATALPLFAPILSFHLAQRTNHTGVALDFALAKAS